MCPQLDTSFFDLQSVLGEMDIEKMILKKRVFVFHNEVVLDLEKWDWRSILEETIYRGHLYLLEMRFERTFS